MFNNVPMRIAQATDLVRSNGWRSLLSELFFFRRTAIVVEKDLTEVTERAEPLANAKLEVIELDQGVLTSGVYRFAVRNRYLKALHYLDRGYGGFALARDGVIVGDTWHCSPKPEDDRSVWPEDLRRFGFRDWKKNEIYTFDIFVAPGERKGGISAAFQNRATLGLRSKGYVKAYGFYWSDNLPARWCTGVTNKWREIRAFRVSRFLIFKHATPVCNDHIDLKSQPAGLANLFAKRKLQNGRTTD